MLHIETRPVGPLQCNCTLIANQQSGQAILIDPGGDAALLLQRLEELGVTLRYVLHTHAHFDHFLASGALREKTHSQLALHPDDRFLWDNLAMQCQLFGLPVPEGKMPPPDIVLAHDQTFSLDSKKETSADVKVLFTPGHTPGSCCFHLEEQKLLLSGDTLFRRGVGRTDLWGGDAQKLFHSIRTELFTLDEETCVVPGHGARTTIREELPLLSHY